LNMLMGWYCN